MLRKRVSKNAEVLKAIVAKLLITSFADDGGDAGDGGTGGNGGTTLNYEDLIKKARQEEKNKLYPEIQKLRRLNEDLTENNNKFLLKIATLEDKIKTLEEKDVKGISDEEATKLRDQIATLEADKKALEEKSGSVPDEEELRKNIRAELEAEFNVKLYRTEKLASDEVKKSVLPMFFDGIVGTTNEEIDQSIEEAIKKTKEAKEQLGITDEDPDDEGEEKEKDDKKSSGSKRPPKASSSAEGTVKKSKYSPEDIQNLDPTSEEFQKLRKDLGLK